MAERKADRFGLFPCVWGVRGLDCCTRLGDINIQEKYVGNSGDLSAISGLGRLSQGDRSKSSSHTFVVTLKEDSLYQWLETVASLKERKAAWFLLWLLDGTFSSSWCCSGAIARSSGFSFLALCDLQHWVKCLRRKEALCIYSSWTLLF